MSEVMLARALARLCGAKRTIAALKEPITNLEASHFLIAAAEIGTELVVEFLAELRYARWIELALCGIPSLTAVQRLLLIHVLKQSDDSETILRVLGRANELSEDERNILLAALADTHDGANIYHFLENNLGNSTPELTQSQRYRLIRGLAKSWQLWTGQPWHWQAEAIEKLPLLDSEKQILREGMR